MALSTAFSKSLRCLLRQRNAGLLTRKRITGDGRRRLWFSPDRAPPDDRLKSAIADAQILVTTRIIVIGTDITPCMLT